MARTLFFPMVLRKLLTTNQKLLTTNQFLVSTIFFIIMNIFFFQSAFWSLFNYRQRSQSNQKQCSVRCCSPCFCVLLCTHSGPLQCFSKYFRKLKAIGVLRPIFPDYVLSCYYELTHGIGSGSPLFRNFFISLILHSLFVVTRFSFTAKVWKEN